MYILEEEMATHSSLLASKNPWTEEPGGLQSMGGKESNTTEHAREHMRARTHKPDGSLEFSTFCPNFT